MKRTKYIYFLLWRNLLKVGCSFYPEWRVKQWRSVTGMNWKLLGFMIGSHEEERSFHRMLRERYPSVDRETFRVGWRFSLESIVSTRNLAS